MLKLSIHHSQVSQLVILHEEAEDGSAMPDLAQPVRVVKAAVDNLVKVSDMSQGYSGLSNVAKTWRLVLL